MTGIGNCPRCSSTIPSTSLILNVVHHCIILDHLATDLQEGGHSNLERIWVGWHLGGDQGCGDTEVEGEEEGEDGEQGVQVQHGHHLILAQAGLPVGGERLFYNIIVAHSQSRYGAHLIPEHSR